MTDLEDINATIADLEATEHPGAALAHARNRRLEFERLDRTERGLALARKADPKYDQKVELAEAKLSAAERTLELTQRQAMVSATIGGVTRGWADLSTDLDYQLAERARNEAKAALHRLRRRPMLLLQEAETRLVVKAKPEEPRESMIGEVRRPSVRERIRDIVA